MLAEAMAQQLHKAKQDLIPNTTYNPTSTVKSMTQYLNNYGNKDQSNSRADGAFALHRADPVRSPAPYMVPRVCHSLPGVTPEAQPAVAQKQTKKNDNISKLYKSRARKNPIRDLGRSECHCQLSSPGL